MENYSDFVVHKSERAVHTDSIALTVDDLNNKLYDFQKDIVRWALAKGRAAIFADCGLGAKVILWTCREGELLTRAVEFCRCFGLEFDAVNDNTEELKRAYGTDPRKIGADYYIDDRAMPPDLFVS